MCSFKFTHILPILKNRLYEKTAISVNGIAVFIYDVDIYYFRNIYPIIILKIIIRYKGAIIREKRTLKKQ